MQDLKAIPEKNTPLKDNAEAILNDGAGHHSIPNLPRPHNEDHNQDANEALAQAFEWNENALLEQAHRLYGEVLELKRNRQWEDIVELCHPLEEKYPALADAGLDGDLKQELAFAMTHLKMHHQALAILEDLMLRADGHLDYKLNYSHAYVSYDALYRHKNREFPLSREEKALFIESAHKFFKRCQEFAPERVTPFYREAMLYKDIESKPQKAIPLFKKAISNWDAYSEEEKKEHHHERPKFIRALYHLASCLLKQERPKEALALLERLLKDDQSTDFVHPHFKHFAMAKVLHRIGSDEKALGHLDIAARERVSMDQRHVPDYVIELRAACLISMDAPEKALKAIRQIPERARRPYVRWREAEALLSLNRHQEALSALASVLDKDRKSRHKTLIKMAKIHYGQRQYARALECAKKAQAFFKATYQNPCQEAVYVEALCVYMAGDAQKAFSLLCELKKTGFKYPGFIKAYNKIKETVEGWKDA